MKNKILLVQASKKRKRKQITLELNIVKRHIKKIDITKEFSDISQDEFLNRVYKMLFDSPIIR